MKWKKLKTEEITMVLESYKCLFQYPFENSLLLLNVLPARMYVVFLFIIIRTTLV